MVGSKSYADYALGVLTALLVDCAVYYPGLRKEFDRDIRRLSSAIECHGLRFITETMPAYRKHFDRCLDARRLTPVVLFHFGAIRPGGTIPRLFRGLILRVFDESGVYRQDADLQAVRLVRQLLGAFRKMRIDCGPSNRFNAVAEFVRIDEECPIATLDWVGGSDTNALSWQAHAYGPELSFQDIGGVYHDAAKATLTPTQISNVLYSVQNAADYIAGTLGHFDPLEWRPKHGPGAVSDQRFGTDKYEFHHWPDRLDRVFPFSVFAYANYAAWVDALKCEDVRLVTTDLPAKMACVPKTTKTPRLIASEPTSLQWCQQVIRDYLYTSVHASVLGKFVSFNDQTHNATLAVKSSSARTHWTIDLSSASDRIACFHVERLFRRNPALLDALQATRSVTLKQAICRKQPQLLRLQKYSTMGNATTFPVQTLFFLAVILGCASYVRKQPVATVVRRANGEEVRVFGDDLVVPADCAQVVVEVLHALNLRVNTDKTFGGLAFRESCGVDACDGEVVTSQAVLDLPERTRPGSVVSSVDVANNLFNAGYLHAATYIRNTVERIGYTKLPNVADGSGRFGWQTYGVVDNSHLKTRWNDRLHRREMLALCVSAKRVSMPPNTNAGLLRYFIEAPEEVTSAESSLTYDTQRPQAKVGLRWVEC